MIKSDELKVPNGKNILILGDSNSETAINDTIFKNAFNLSSSADPYFYTYLKFKEIIPANKQIDTVILSFSPQNIFKNNWTFDGAHINSRLAVYYPFMDKKDIQFLLKGNSKAVISSSVSIVKQTLSNSIQRLTNQNSINDYGHFLRLERNTLSEVQEKLKNNEPLPFFDIPQNLDVAESEVLYLNKIIETCKANDLKLYLVNMPKRHELLNYSKYGVKEFNAYYDKNHSDITFLDLSRLKLPDDYYADFVHLNFKGSDYFSEYLEKNSLGKLTKLYAR